MDINVIVKIGSNASLWRDTAKHISTLTGFNQCNWVVFRSCSVILFIYKSA